MFTFRCVFILTGLLLFCPAIGWGALVVQDSDIADGHFTYDLTYDEMPATTENPTTVAAFAEPLESTNNLLFEQTGDIRFLDANNVSGTESDPATAGFTFKFNFSESGYRPTQLDLRDVIKLFPTNENAQATVEYSVDGDSWTLLRSQVTGDEQDAVQEYSIPLSQVDAVWYRVTFTALGDDNYDLRRPNNQWNRIDSNDPYFLADFAVTPIPEPGSFVLFGMGVLIVLTRQRFG